MGSSSGNYLSMDRAEVALAVCELALYLREHPDTSFASRRQELLGLGVIPVSESDLAPILSMRSQLVDSWESYVEDQRTFHGWYVTVRNVPGGKSEWIVARRGNTNSSLFDSRIAAFAALIVRIVGQPLCA